jgi:hypothetical protein
VNMTRYALLVNRNKMKCIIINLRLKMNLEYNLKSTGLKAVLCIQRFIVLAAKKICKYEYVCNNIVPINMPLKNINILINLSSSVLNTRLLYFIKRLSAPFRLRSTHLLALRLFRFHSINRKLIVWEEKFSEKLMFRFCGSIVALHRDFFSKPNWHQNARNYFPPPGLTQPHVL